MTSTKKIDYEHDYEHEHEKKTGGAGAVLEFFWAAFQGLA
jgi:hypothetical protein